MESLSQLNDEILFERCKQKFLNGHSYPSIVQFLEHNNIQKDRIKTIVQKLDEYEKINNIDRFADEKKEKKSFVLIKFIAGMILVVIGIVIVNIGVAKGVLMVIPLSLFLVGTILIIKEVSALVDKYMD